MPADIAPQYNIPPTKAAGQRLACITMLRNEIDIIDLFMQRADELFDRLILIDMQSTDGTRHFIQQRQMTRCNVEVYDFRIKARYQSEILRLFSLKAAHDGADWIFLLDTDEFLDIATRSNLDDYLSEFRSEIMHMPWINLVPTKYGHYSTFDTAQEFYWSGRTSLYSKIALSSSYILKNPSLVICAGQHSVAANSFAQSESVSRGLALLHLPVRSSERLRYKVDNALVVDGAKHNKQHNEGQHHIQIHDLISLRGLSDRVMHSIAADYGLDTHYSDDLDPAGLGWPTKRIPMSQNDFRRTAHIPVSLPEVLRLDQALHWQQVDFIKDSPIQAAIEDGEVRLLPCPLSGGGQHIGQRYKTLPATSISTSAPIGPSDLFASIAASVIPPEIVPFSAWSQLSPVLFSLFAVLRPRRYVELGVHNGMSFFVACQASKALGTKTNCIAVDSWIGDPHASFHSPTVFAKFESQLRTIYPEQHYIRAFFDDALDCFEAGSIDLLHIDGFHSYDAVKQDYHNWLPKMSAQGVMIFHDINVFDRGFGVWLLWEDIKRHYPTFSFMHGHGLGIAYVGDSNARIAELLDKLAHDKLWHDIIQHYYGCIGSLVLNYANLKIGIIDAETNKRESDPQKDRGSGDELQRARESEQVCRALHQEALERERVVRAELQAALKRELRLKLKRKSAAEQGLRYKAGLKRVLKSRWWKVTAPLRRLCDGLRRLRGRRPRDWPTKVDDV